MFSTYKIGRCGGGGGNVTINLETMKERVKLERRNIKIKAVMFNIAALYEIP